MKHPSQPNMPESHSYYMAKLYYVFGIGFGSGLSPKAPGTVGSLVSLIMVPLWAYLGFGSSAIVMAIMMIFGIPICAHTARLMKTHDDPRIVWDEWVGQSITLLPLIYMHHLNWLSVTAGFILFRLFDVIKPWPIASIDQKVSGGLGIMLDDVIAGMMAAAWLYVLIYFIPSLS